MQTWCIDCRTISPKTESLYELGAEGWRATRGVDGAHFEWRCPACWIVFKEAMGDAVASSACFRAAPAIEQPISGDTAEWTQSGERPTHAEDDTLPDNRPNMIVRTLHEVFDALSRVPVSSRSRELRARADRYQSLVSHWTAAPPSREEQLDVFDRLSRLHADASALVAACRRFAR
jgi:hypothetical protein